jgi:hypothetical protein
MEITPFFFYSTAQATLCKEKTFMQWNKAQLPKKEHHFSSSGSCFYRYIATQFDIFSRRKNRYIYLTANSI